MTAVFVYPNKDTKCDIEICDFHSIRQLNSLACYSAPLRNRSANSLYITHEYGIPFHPMVEIHTELEVVKEIKFNYVFRI